MVSFTAIFTALAAAALVVAAPVEVAERDLVERGSYSGKATWYRQNGNAGSCGSKVVAMNTKQSRKCGQSVRIKNKKNGKTVTAKVMDTCPGCGYGSLDLSMGAFEAIG